MKTAIIFVALLGVVSLGGCERNPSRSLPKQNSNQAESQAQEMTEAERTALELRAANWLAKSSEFYTAIGWHEVPPWATELPFDLKSLIDIPADENRESLWINAFLEFSMFDFGGYFPDLQANQELMWPCARHQSEHRNKAIDFYLKHVNQDHRPGNRLAQNELETAKQLLAPFHVGFEKLELTRQRPHCILHSDWETNTISNSVLAAPNIQYLVALHFQSEMPDSNSLRLIEVGLQLHRDLARLPQLVDQISLNRMERSIYYDMVHLILEHEDLTAETLERLISILQQHDSEYWETDPFVEVTRRELLDFRHLFHQLTHQTYLTPKRAKDLFLESDATLMKLLIRQVVDLGFYGIHVEEVKTEIKRIASKSAELDAAWKKMDSDKNLESDGARLILQSFIPLGLETLEPSDLDEDIEVLNTRHQQVVDATRLPYPDSSVQLLKLEENWTLDDSWKNTKILRWFQPQKRATRLRQVSHNRYGAYLCLAALRKWQFDHPGGSPADLKQALTAIGLDQIPVDAYTGKSLQFLELENEFCVYSIGPDGVDDKAQKELAPNQESDILGDITFRLIKR